MVNVEELLKPISPENPCGEDFSYHPDFQNLETISRGKAKTQFDPADAPDWKEPDWKEVQDAATEVLKQSKHLMAGVVLAVASMKVDGLEGLRDGLAVVRGTTEQYWGELYPRLDPTDNNDPTERLNILNNLASSGEPYKFTLHLKQLVVCDSPAMGRITLQQVINAKNRAKGEPVAASGAGKSDPDLTQIQAAFQDAGPEPAASMLAVLNDVIGQAEGIETFVESTLGAGKGVTFEPLNKLLAEMKHTLEPYATNGSSTSATAEDGADATGSESSVGRGGRVGSIQNRADVIKTLQLIYEYYREREPSSPVPLILQRAERLVDKDFMAIVTDLTPDAVSQLQVITGKPAE